MSIKAVIFDFGGVLLKWNPHNLFRRHFDNEHQTVESFLKEINFTEWNSEQDKGRPFSEGIAVLSGQFPQYSHIIHSFQDDWEQSLEGTFEESVELLKLLKQNGYPIFGLSNWSAETFPIARKRFDFFELFEGMIISGEVRLIKPDPAIFELCLKMVRKPAHECLFIDDSEKNILTAEHLGFETILFRSPGQLKRELQLRNLL